jgi:hypothetical protein
MLQVRMIRPVDLLWTSWRPANKWWYKNVLNSPVVSETPTTSKGGMVGGTSTMA